LKRKSVGATLWGDAGPPLWSPRLHQDSGRPQGGRPYVSCSVTVRDSLGKSTYSLAVETIGDVHRRGEEISRNSIARRHGPQFGCRCPSYSVKFSHSPEILGTPLLMP
jgi:hypothetical protein